MFNYSITLVMQRMEGNPSRHVQCLHVQFNLQYSCFITAITVFKLSNMYCLFSFQIAVTCLSTPRACPLWTHGINLCFQMDDLFLLFCTSLYHLHMPLKISVKQKNHTLREMYILKPILFRQVRSHTFFSCTIVSTKLQTIQSPGQS